MVEKHQDPNHPARIRVVGALSLVEDVVYTGLGVLLSIAAIVLLARGFKSFYLIVVGRASSSPFVELLDQVLLVLLVVELLYTVQVSFRERGIVAEPFLVVALIAIIRRVLVLTAEMPTLAQSDETSFRHASAEFALLTLMIVVLVGSLIMLQRHARQEAGDGPLLRSSHTKENDPEQVE